ncbi:MAG: hypothetical protein M3Q97_06830, partial [Bacteroidota bacterium]|nr:hypothetical protein [Bacteroidota bacterium]
MKKVLFLLSMIWLAVQDPVSAFAQTNPDTIGKTEIYVMSDSITKKHVTFSESGICWNFSDDIQDTIPKEVSNVDMQMFKFSIGFNALNEYYF